MGRKNSGARSTIQSLCEMDNIDEKCLYEKAKMLLGIYRKVCWSAIGSVDQVAEEMCYYCGSDLDRALIYLEEFAPDKDKERFESRIKTLFETRWMIELVDNAMVKVYEFPEYGKMYHEIISKAYLTKFKYTEGEMLEVLDMERSRYYDRKKEAITVFGLSLWGSALPKLKSFLEDEVYDEVEGMAYGES